MRKIFILGVICYATFLNGMEKNSTLIFNYSNASIALIQGDLLQRPSAQAAAITVVGAWQQYRARQKYEPDLCETPVIGDAFILPPLVEIYIEDMITKTVKKKNWSKCIGSVGEPELSTSRHDGKFYYHPTRHKNPKTPNDGQYTDPEYVGEVAVQEAEKDLALCYDNILKKSDDPGLAIAFPSLSTLPQYFPEKAATIAILSVKNFIENPLTKDVYKNIQFVIKEKNQYELYYKLLSQFLNK